MSLLTGVGVFFLVCAGFCGGMATAIDACRRGAPADRQTRNGAVELMILAVIVAGLFFLHGWWAWLLAFVPKGN